MRGAIRLMRGAIRLMRGAIRLMRGAIRLVRESMVAYIEPLASPTATNYMRLICKFPK
jgi:hypothetical protein